MDIKCFKCQTAVKKRWLIFEWKNKFTVKVGFSPKDDPKKAIYLKD